MDLLDSSVVVIEVLRIYFAVVGMYFVVVGIYFAVVNLFPTSLCFGVVFRKTVIWTPFVPVARKFGPFCRLFITFFEIAKNRPYAK